jgi:flavin-binding protein dodecin
LSEHVYKSVEITGTSADGVGQAIENAIAKAARTLRNLDWFEVGTIRGYINDGEVAHFQVQMKVGFRIETP